MSDPETGRSEEDPARQGVSRTTVTIIGAGPAGLVLGNRLLAAGSDCVILERQTRAYVERRARAGFLVANTVRILDRDGLARGLHQQGQPHDTCAFRGEFGQFEVKYGAVGRREGHVVYPQQDLVRDLVEDFLARGGDLRFEATAMDITGADTTRPSVTYWDADGESHRLECRFVAGCDGQHGVAVSAVPEARTRRFQIDHGVSWLAVLVAAPQCMPAVTYAVNDYGFAGHMARSADVTRYYLQCDPGEDPAAWPDERIWAELRSRFRTGDHGDLATGRVIERSRVDMASLVIEPIQYGSLLLAGDAASRIGPVSAKGANLAVMEADVLATALIDEIGGTDRRAIADYSARCLPRIWRAQEFSRWMIDLLHAPPGPDSDSVFARRLRSSRLERLRDEPGAQEAFAEGYVGI